MRDPEMHQTKKGNQWYFGMKAHIGVDSKTKLIHSVVATAANVADSQVLPELLHGQKTRVWGDRAYQGQTQVIRQCAPKAKDMTQRRCRNRGKVDEVERAKNRNKSRVRESRTRVRCHQEPLRLRESALQGENANRLFATCALANLYLARHHLLRLQRARCAQ
jgi:IS5 family transposase